MTRLHFTFVLLFVVGFVHSATSETVQNPILTIDSARLDARLRLAPLIALNNASQQLGVSLEERRRLNEQLNRKDVRWQQSQSLINEILKPAEQRKHRRFCFQFVVAKGWPVAALRYVGVELPVAEANALTEAADKLRPEVEYQQSCDAISIAQEPLTTLMQPGQLVKVVGDPYRFRLRRLQQPLLWEPFELNLASLDLVQSPYLQKHLKLEIGQVRLIREFCMAQIRHVEDSDLSSLEDADLRFLEQEIHQALTQFLSPEQVHRLEQILVQRFLRWNHLSAAIHHLNLTNDRDTDRKQFRRKSIGLGAAIRAAEYLRAYRMYVGLLEPHLTDAVLADLTRDLFVPQDLLGNPPPLTANVFRELTQQQGSKMNPRRTR